MGWGLIAWAQQHGQLHRHRSGARCEISSTGPLQWLIPRAIDLFNIAGCGASDLKPSSLINMWLYLHHTCSDLIDLDPGTGRWRHVLDEEKPQGKVLADLPVQGSYLEENGKRYHKYWTDGGRFVFSTSDGCAIDVCRKHGDGRIEMLVPGLHCDIAPSKLTDGRLRPGYSDVSLKDGAGTTLCVLTYHSAYYARLFNSDITAAAMVQDLSDWDFFVALQGGIEIFTERAKSGRVPLLACDQVGSPATAITR